MQAGKKKAIKIGLIAVAIIIIIVMYLIYNYSNKSVDEIIEEEIYVESNENFDISNRIILHITGEVNKPRNY